MQTRSPKSGGPALNGAPRRLPHFAGNVGLRPILWIAGLVASAASALVAASQSRTGLGGANLVPAPAAIEAQIPRDLAGLSGFQRRGNALIGDVCTRSGTMLRLVFDARSHALIGLKIVENQPGGTSCRLEGAIAPLPATAPPAN